MFWLAPCLHLVLQPSQSHRLHFSPKCHTPVSRELGEEALLSVPLYFLFCFPISSSNSMLLSLSSCLPPLSSPCFSFFSVSRGSPYIVIVLLLSRDLTLGCEASSHCCSSSCPCVLSNSASKFWNYRCVPLCPACGFWILTNFDDFKHCMCVCGGDGVLPHSHMVTNNSCQAICVCFF